ncbi:MAG: hypothetical protein ACQES4_00660 [Bacillota bacterium]
MQLIVSEARTVRTRSLSSKFLILKKNKVRRQFYLLLSKPLEEQMLRPLKMLEFYGQPAGCRLPKSSQETIVLGNRKTPAYKSLT